MPAFGLKVSDLESRSEWNRSRRRCYICHDFTDGTDEGNCEVMVVLMMVVMDDGAGGSEGGDVGGLFRHFRVEFVADFQSYSF